MSKLDLQTPDFVAANAARLAELFPSCVTETKGSMSSLELREIETTCINCARKFFARITSNEVKYDVVSSYEKLMELVK